MVLHTSVYKTRPCAMYKVTINIKSANMEIIISMSSRLFHQKIIDMGFKSEMPKTWQCIEQACFSTFIATLKGA